MNKILWIVCLLLSSTSLMSQENEFEYSAFNKTNKEQIYHYFRLEGGYTFGKFIGLKQNYGELGLFSISKIKDPWYLFSDLCGYALDNGYWAGSLGSGTRYLHESGSIFGINFYYDFRDTRIALLQRVGVGLEYLGNYFDIRINGYFPVNGNTKHSSLHIYNDYIGNYQASCRSSDYLFKGVDAEIGCNFYQGCNFSLYGAIGPYYYHHQKTREIYGGQGCLELSWKDYLRFRVNLSHDNKFHTNVQGKIMLSIPLSDIFYCGCSLLDFCQSHLNKPIERNGLIFTDHRHNYSWNW